MSSGKSTFDDSKDDMDDLFNKMKGTAPKKQKHDSDEEELSEEKKQVLKYGFDYYKILGVPKFADFKKDLDSDEDTRLKTYEKFIKAKYFDVLKKYHPDKLPKNISQEEKKRLEKTYQLIREAGSVLTNESQRKFYDLQQKTIKSKDFLSQRNSFEDFKKLQESEITDEKKAIAQIEFKRDFDKMNDLRGFDPDSAKVKLTNGESKQRHNDLIAQREMEEIEFSKPNLFDGRKFDTTDFNKMFEKQKKKEEKRKKMREESGAVVKYNDDRFTAFNDDGVGNFISINDNYGEIFGDDNVNGTNVFSRAEKEDSESMSSVSSNMSDDIDVSYVKGHNQNKLTKADFDNYQKTREQESTLFQNLKYSDYKDVTHDQFGISKDFGYMIGKDVTNTTRKKPKDLNSDLMNAYNRLLKHDKTKEKTNK